MSCHSNTIFNLLYLNISILSRKHSTAAVISNDSDTTRRLYFNHHMKNMHQFWLQDTSSLGNQISKHAGSLGQSCNNCFVVLS